MLARAPVPVFRLAGTVMAVALWCFAPRRRRVVHTNLRLCFPEVPEAQRRRWGWQTFQGFSQSFLDRVWLWHGSPERVRRRVQIIDPQGVLQRDGPVICFAPHFFGLDAGWAALTLAGKRRWLTLYAPQDTAWIDHWVRDGRKRFGSPRLVSRREGMRPLLKGLKEGGSLYLLPDMDLGARNSVFVSFFGVTAATVTSLPRLSEATGAPVVTVVSRMVSGGYVIEVGDVWAGYPTGDDASDARHMNQVLESLIETMPGQYHWLHRRFKTRPQGEPPVYVD